MGFFLKDGKSKVPVAPPIFSKHAEQSLLKMTSSRRLVTLHNSSPALGVSFRREQPSAKNRRGSFSDRIASAPAQVALTIKPKSVPINRTNPLDGSYVEESVGDDSYYEEEIIVDDEYYEEEIIEIVEESKSPEREITIKFDDFDQMQTTLHINDFSSAEVINVWYCRADYDKMVEKARSTAAKVEAKEAKKSKSDEKKKENDKKAKESVGKSSSDKGKNKKELDTRGLEGWTTDGSKKARELKEEALEAVWNEQNRQFTTTVFDKEKIRAAYLTASAGAQAMAEARAAEDQASAEKIHNKSLKQKKRDMRGMMNKSKSAFGKSMKGGLMSKAKKKGSKATHKNKRIEETEQRQLFRQPSQGSRLFLEQLNGESSSGPCFNMIYSFAETSIAFLTATPSWQILNRSN
jgi:hypothetical protein